MRFLIALSILAALLVWPAAVSAQPKERPPDQPAAKQKKEPTPADKEAAGALAVGGTLCILISIVAGLAFYFAPVLIALLRGHPNMAPIMVVNFFLGWTLIGWVVALTWAFTAQERHRADYGRRRRDDYDD